MWLFDSTNLFDIGALVRFRCLRNGNIASRCRWTWNQVMQRSSDGIHWETRASDDFC